MSETQSKDRSWLYVGIVFAMFWAFYLLFFNPRGRTDGLSAPSLTAPAFSAPADYSWTLEDLQGKPVSLGDFRGKPIVLNIWATWCPPCRLEMPSLVALAANPDLKNVVFLGVTNEPPGAAVKRYADENMTGIRTLYAEKTPAVFASDGIPATFIIAPDGKIVSAETGAVSWDDPTVVLFLKKLEKPSEPLKP